MSKISDYAYDAFSPYWGMDTFLARQNNLENYHLEWLKAHPGRTVQWLCDRLKDGFDIHHIDGDHSNNDPANLALIEHQDHMRFHGLTNSYRLRNLSKGPRITTLSSGKLAYEAKQQGKTWHEIGYSLQSAARVYAVANNLPWPITAKST